MINLIRIEAVKLRTTPALAVTALASVVLGIISAVTNTLMGGRNGAPAVGTSASVEKTFTQPVAVGSTAMLVLGILAIAGEYRHRTLQSTFLGEQRRWRIVVAKLVTIALVGAGLGALTFGTVLAVDLPLYASKGVHHLPISITTYWSGAVLAGGCFGLLGVALGAATRNATAAIVTGLVWTQVVETTLLQGSVPNLAKWLPTEAAVALTPGTSTAHLLAPLTAACVLVGWAMALAAAATRFSVRGDVR